MNVERTIAFVDLAVFTALTEVHDDHAADELIDAFIDLAHAAVAGTTTWLAKTSGAAVMLAAPSPADGVDAVRRVFEATCGRDGFPEPRAGAHHGPVIESDGDYFGATVTIAARVASRAAGGQAVVTATVVDAARASGLDTVALGATQLRNALEPVQLWAVEFSSTEIELSVDPVCRVRLRRQAAVARVRHRNSEHVLCSLACAAAFTADPDRYLTATD